MNALRFLVVDLLALALLAVAAFTQAPWAIWTAGIYAALMLALKVVALLSKIPNKRPADAPPEGVYHVIYGVGAAMLVFGAYTSGARGLYTVAALWTLLWVLDWYGARQR